MKRPKKVSPIPVPVESNTITTSTVGTHSKANSVDTQDLAGKRCAFKTYHESVKGGIPVSEPISDPFGKLKPRDDDSAYALVIKRTFEEHKPQKTTLTINSSHILQAFRDVIESYAPVPSDFRSPVELKGPFEMLVHYWDELEEYRLTAPYGEAQRHLDLLFEFMENEIKPDRDRALKMIEDKQIDYRNAWVIYRPGDIVYTEVEGHPWLLVCKKMAYEEDRESGPYIDLHCEYTDHDGTIVGDAERIFKIRQREKFPQESPTKITELPAYPRQFVDVGDALERRCRVRGERYLALQDRTTVAYDGPAEWLKEPPIEYYDPSGCKLRGVWLPYTEAGRVILDRKTFGEEQRMGKVHAKLAEPKHWLCPPFTLGYSLGRKLWCRFYVENIKDVSWKPNAWGSLVLPDKEKLLLRSLVTSHEFAKSPRDAMLQKGKGLVVLLHGTPGSGKTLTAETAAEGSRKALVSTSIGELNRGSNILTGSMAFEKELNRVLQYATIWRAIVLLDEADIFLEARKDNSKDRNAMVAIFLRELEYFGGIVFLTTNRVSSFDPAMKSRIHVALGYRPPGLDVRRRIWLEYLRNVPMEASAIKPEAAVDQLAEVELNGREIANAVNTARTMARFEGFRMNIGHIETVLDVRRAFDASLNGGEPSVEEAQRPGCRIV
ncbi:P-loop containing nucleoside triphosphate hydrolase protein [Xylariaceae sp. FL0016]|nr:P-loop containing nucleoside triphosphate hydrolase protein [Xylariaceae sp. FL0016]